MSFLGSLGVLPQIDGVIQEGRGVAAAVLGQTYNVYRLSDTSTGSILSGDPLYQSFPARIRKLPSRHKAIEGVIFELVAFESACNNLVLEIGDFLVEEGYGSTGSAYVVAEKRPTRETVLMRCETNCAIMHPYSLAGTQAEQPTSGIVWNDDYGGPEQLYDQNIVLQNGLYATDPTYTMSPATIPCGLAPLNRIRDSKELGLPTEIPSTRFVMYVPLLPGYQISQNDKIKAENQDTYLVEQDYTSGDVGISGYILLVARVTT